MRKRIYIELIIDEDASAGNSTTEHDLKTGKFTIRVVPSALVNQPSLISTTAHELGHVLGEIFQTPAHVNDPRTSGDRYTRFRLRMGISDPGDMEGMVASEQAAWDLARQMTDQVDSREECAAMDTYRDIENYR